MTEPTKAAPAGAPAPLPKYRYTTVAPGTIRVAVSELSPAIPARAWRGGERGPARELTMPCAEIFQTGIPRIRLARLGELLPGCIEAGPDAPEWIDLPAGALARAYHPVTHRERIEEPAPAPVPVSATESEKSEPADEPSTPAGKPASNGPPLVVIEKRTPGWKRILKPIRNPSRAVLDEQEQAPGGEKTAPEAEPPAGDAPVAAVEAPEPEPPAPAPAPVPPVALAGAPIADASELQALLMTEDELTVRRVVELSAALPGLRGCILSAGNETVPSGGMPGAVDILPLRERAKTLLEGARAPGISLLPALTFYSDAGPVSYLAHGKLELMVLHLDRGFFPGVREKLGAVLGALARQLA
jgi:hypothetical protein